MQTNGSNKAYYGIYALPQLQLIVFAGGGSEATRGAVVAPGCVSAWVDED